MSLVEFTNSKIGKRSGSFTEGLEKIGTHELIEKSLTLPYSVLHISGFEVIYPRVGEPYAVFSFKEVPGKYWNGCMMATEVALLWMEHFEGDKTACLEQIEYEHVGFRLSSKVGKNGRAYTVVQVVAQA